MKYIDLDREPVCPS